jgi:hypothetical protein
VADFGAEIRFQLRLQGDDPVTGAVLLYQVDDSNVQNTATTVVRPGTGGARTTATYVWRVAGVLLPGSQVTYQWQVQTASGQRATTAEQTVSYDDTRFSWRQASTDGVTVFYTAGDPQSGQALVDEARSTLNRLKSDFGLTLDKPLRVYAYARQEDYTSAVYTGSPLEPSLTVGDDRIFVLAPGGTPAMSSALQGLRKELATALFLQKTENAYADPPHWLALGFAYVMSGEELTADTNKALGQLAQTNKLLPLRSLNGNFPNNDRDLNLAYVQSASAVQYIAGTYGADKLRAVLAAFKDGNTTDDALRKGLGVTLDQFETKWKNALKSGQASRPISGQQGQGAPGAQSGAPQGNGGMADRMFGPALRFWRGVFGPNTQVVLIGVAAAVGFGIVALVVGSGVSIWRRARAEDD